MLLLFWEGESPRGRSQRSGASPGSNIALAISALRRVLCSPVREAKLVDAHVRLFADDVASLKKSAREKGYNWQIELRQLVRSALRGEQRSIGIVRETP